MFAKAIVAACLIMSPLVARAELQDEGFIGEIRLLSTARCPIGWVVPQGQLRSISNDSLFPIIGYTYGGDHKTLYALLDLRHAAPVSVNGGLLIYCLKLGPYLPDPASSPTPPFRPVR